jgi:hypothetical protein
MLAAAILLLLCGACSTLFYILLPLNTKDAAGALQSNVVCGSTAAFGLLFGVVFALQGWNGILGRASRPAARAFPPLILLVIVFVAALALGVGALALNFAAAYLFPPWHFLAALVPPMTLLAFAAHRLGKSSGLRALLASFGWGAFVATVVAFVLEILIAGVFVVIAALVIVNMPDSREFLLQLQAQVERAQRTQDFSALARYLSNPAVVSALILYFAVVIPPIEEAVKALVVAFCDPRRTRARDALLWGMAAGAGFAVMENVFNSSVVLATWAPLALMRVGAAVVHVANGANIGLGWYAARAEGRWGRLLLAYGVSVIFHAIWNGAAVLMSSGDLQFASSGASAATVFSASLLLVLVIVAAMGLAWIAYLVGHYTELERSQ